MGKITVINNVTLDGVMQAPGGKDEDTRDNFPYGGWTIPFQDEVIGKKMGGMMATGNVPYYLDALRMNTFIPIGLSKNQTLLRTTLTRFANMWSLQSLRVSFPGKILYS